MGVRDFVIEGDSLVIVQVLKECSPTPSSVSALVYGMLDEYNEFRNVGLSHVRRQSNRPTHLLAKQVIGLFDFSALIDECPCFLEHVLIHDVFVSILS